MQFLLVVTLLFAVASAKFPAGFQKCPKNDKDCLKNAIQSAVKLLENGLPELEIGPLNKLPVPEFKIGAGSIVQLTQNYKDGFIYGLADQTIDNYVFDVDQGKIEFEAHADFVQFNGTYDINGKLLVFPVFGKGSCMLRLENVKLFLKLNVDKITKNGKEYLKCKLNSLDFDVKHATFYFENLFDGNKQLGDNINKVLNENWKEIYDELIGGYNLVFGTVVANYASKILGQIPINELYS